VPDSDAPRAARRLELAVKNEAMAKRGATTAGIMTTLMKMIQVTAALDPIEDV
jgi:hypothetical protein